MRSPSDAFCGLKSLVEQDASSHAQSALSLAAAGGEDADSSVRKSAFDVIECVFSLVGVPRLEPFLPLLLARTSAALSHSDDGVRVDALARLSLLIRTVPSIVLPHSSRLIPCLIGLLDGGRGTSLAAVPGGRLASPAARASVLETIVDFLHILLPLDTASDDMYYVGWKAAGGQGRPWQSQSLEVCSTQLPDMLREKWMDHSQVDDEIQYDLEMLSSLVPLLLECWLESGVTLCDASHQPKGIQVRTATAVLTALDSLLKVVPHPNLVLIRRHLMTPFPFGGHAPIPTSTAINARICAVMAHCVDDAASWIDPLCTHLLSQRSTLLPLIGVFLSKVNDEWRDKLINGVTALAESSSPTSPSHHQALGFGSSLLLSKPQLSDELTRRWLCILPRSLWKLKGTNPSCSSGILSALTSIVIRAAEWPSPESIDLLRNSLIPLFGVVVHGKPTMGPFVTYSPSLQRQTLGLLYHFPSPPDLKLITSLSLCSAHPTTSAETVHSLIEFLHHRRLEIPFKLYLSFLVTSLVKRSETVSVGQIIESVGWALCHCGADVSPAIPSLIHSISGQSSAKAVLLTCAKLDHINDENKEALREVLHHYIEGSADERGVKDVNVAREMESVLK